MAQISVIMPVYNAGKFLQQAIDSILQQDFTDFEFLICNDCSSDCSGEIITRYAAIDNRIKLLHNERNSGITFTLNKLLSHAAAPLIARMDADDIALPNRLSLQFEFMRQHPEVAVAGGSLEIIDEENSTLGKRIYPQSFDNIRKVLLCQNPLAHPSVVMRRDVIEKLGGYQEQTGCEDYCLWLRAVENGFELANLPQILLQYRLSANQIKQRDMKKSLHSTIRLQKKYICKRKFFSFKALCFLFAEYGLMMLPNKWILKLFTRVTYK